MIQVPFSGTPEDAGRALGAVFGDFVLASNASGTSISCGARAALVLEGRTLTLTQGNERESIETNDPFADAPRLLSRVTGPFRAWGYVGFETASFIYRYAKTWPRSLHLLVPSCVCRFEHDHLTLTGDPKALERAKEALAGRIPERPRTITLGEAVVEVDPKVYFDAIATTQAAIGRGELEKAIISRAVEIAGRRLDPLATFRNMQKLTSSLRYAYQLGGIAGAGACPALMLEVAQNIVRTTPLAGTRPRGKTEEEDKRLTRELLADPKELSEHAMSIRHAYEELRPVVSPETLRVIDFMQLRQYPYTHHIASTAVGTLAQGRGPWDALRAVFPAVTVTGTPKVDALPLIDRVETRPRGNYGGAFGYVDSDGSMEWGVAIRSVFDYGNSVTLNAGAGIVRDSNPTEELLESSNKMKTMASITEATQP